MVELISGATERALRRQNYCSYVYARSYFTRRVARVLLQLRVLNGVALDLHELLKISQNVADNFLKRCSNLAPNKSKRKFRCFLLLFGLMQKYMEVRFQSIFLQFRGVTSIAK